MKSGVSFGSDVRLGALVILHISTCPLLIEGEILGGLRHRDSESVDEVRSVQTTLPEQPQLYEFRPLLDTQRKFLSLACTPRFALKPTSSGNH